MTPNAETTSHPSFGTIAITRCQGTGTSLFLSPYKHNNFIALEVHHADKIRDYSSDRAHSTEHVLTLLMSEAQFASLITGVNMGGSAACTIEKIAGENIEECPEDFSRDTFSREILADLESLAEDVDAVASESDGKVSKTIQKKIAGIATMIRNRLPFLQEQAEKAIDNAVISAKADIDAHVHSVITRTGLAALKGEKTGLPELPFGAKKEESK
jgi:hypothetical protein